MVGWPHGQAVCPEGRRAHEAVCLKLVIESSFVHCLA
jgi:hypothetical protein